MTPLPEEEYGAMEEETPLEESLPEWKERARREYLDWLDGLDPERGEWEGAEEEEREAETPDLFSFFSELAALRAEFRTSGRRSQETLGRFEAALQGFEGMVGRIGEGLAGLEKDRREEGRKILKPLLLSLLGTAESLERLETGLSRRPRRSWFGERRQWTESWESFQSAVGLARANLEKLLQKEGVSRIRTRGERFDPLTMRAVAVEPGGPGGTVLREVAPGYALGDEILKIAEVVVGKDGESADGS